MTALSAEYDYLLKFVLIGESGTGKSSIMTRYSNGTFDSGYVSTIGVDFSISMVTVRGKTVKVQVWDTAGQERFANITTSYYRGAHCIVIVYDVTSRSSFQALPAWMARIRDHAPDVPHIMVVGNKSDLGLGAGRAVRADEGREFAGVHGAHFLETSALSNTNVSAVFERLCAAAVDRKIAIAAAEKTPYVEPETVILARRDGAATCC